MFILRHFFVKGLLRHVILFSAEISHKRRQNLRKENFLVMVTRGGGAYSLFPDNSQYVEKTSKESG